MIPSLLRNRLSTKLAVSLGVLLLMIISCKKTTTAVNIPVAKGSRHLGIHITPAQNQDYGSAFNQARSTGADCLPITFQWPALEANGVYDPQGLMSDLNDFYGVQPVSLSLCVSPIAADRRDVPADLQLTAFDDPAMIQRFNRLLDTLHGRMPTANIRYLLIGNEVDNYFSLHPQEWTAYTSFCNAARQHARSIWGNQLQVGAETTLGGTIGASAQPITALETSMDILCLTYYPLNDDFTMAPVAKVAGDFSALLSKYPGRQVLMQEVGYATSAGCGGSDTAQTSFVHEVFRIWDLYPDQINYVAFLWLNDLSDSQSQAVTVYYGLNGTPVEATFTAYIGSLGLCDPFANPKAGFVALQKEAAIRGW